MEKQDENDAKTAKIIPKHLVEMVLEYCETAGYTLDEVLEVGNSISNSVRHIFWDNVVKNMPYKKTDEEEKELQAIRSSLEPYKTRVSSDGNPVGNHIKGIVIDLPNHGIQQEAKESK